MEWITIFGYDDVKFEVKKQWITPYVRDHYGIPLERFLNEYTWDWADVLLEDAKKQSAVRKVSEN